VRNEQSDTRLLRCPDQKWPVEPHCSDSAKPRPPNEGKLPIDLSLRFVPIRDGDSKSFGICGERRTALQRLAPSPLVFEMEERLSEENPQLTLLID